MFPFAQPKRPAAKALSPFDKAKSLIETGNAQAMEQFASYLTEHSDCIQMQDEKGRTLLHYAAQANNASACQTLVEFFQMDVNAEDKEGMRPLLLATERPTLDALVVLGAEYGTLFTPFQPQVKEDKKADAKADAAAKAELPPESELPASAAEDATLDAEVAAFTDLGFGGPSQQNGGINSPPAGVFPHAELGEDADLALAIAASLAEAESVPPYAGASAMGSSFFTPQAQQPRSPSPSSAAPRTEQHVDSQDPFGLKTLSQGEEKKIRDDFIVKRTEKGLELTIAKRLASTQTLYLIRMKTMSGISVGTQSGGDKNITFTNIEVACEKVKAIAEKLKIEVPTVTEASRLGL